MPRAKANRGTGDPAARQGVVSGKERPAFSEIATVTQAALDLAIDVSPPVDPFLAERAERIRILGKRVIGDVIEIGRLLAECKSRFGHGDNPQFLAWAREQFGWSDRTTYKFLSVNDLVSKPDFAQCANLEIDVSALYLLAAPSTPEPARAEVLDRAEAGESLAHAEVRAIIEAHGERSILQAASEIRARNIEERRAERLARIAAQCDPGPLPKGPWPILFADPAWRYDFSTTSSRAIERHYETMSLEETCALPVGEIAAENAALFLCVPQAINEQAFAVIKAWDFKYCSGAVWEKTGGPPGEGFYFRFEHELFLMAKRGDFPPPPPALRLPSIIKAPRGAHSAKPDAVYEAVERMYPGLQRIELFCRGRPRPGWAGWGNEAQPAAAEPPPRREAAPGPAGPSLADGLDIPACLRRGRTTGATP
jgi:N6-adenosine-specific RNA methylase IME4